MTASETLLTEFETFLETIPLEKYRGGTSAHQNGGAGPSKGPEPVARYLQALLDGYI